MRNNLSPSTPRPPIVALIFVLLAAVLRFYRLEDQSLWNDEMFSFDLASSTFAAIQQKLAAFYHHPPLFFYLARIALVAFRNSAWALRFVSALFGSLAVGGVYSVATRMFGRQIGLVAGILCLVSPFHLAYSQEGRPYALAGFLCLLSTYLLYSFACKKSIPTSVGYVLSATALLYTHHWGLFVLAAHLVSTLIVLRPNIRTLTYLIVFWVTIAIFYIPEAMVLREQSASLQSNGWFWSEPPNPQTIINLGFAFTGTFFKMASSIFDSELWMKMLAIVCLFILSVLGCYRAIRFSSIEYRFVLMNLILILLIPFFLAFIKPEIFLWYRYTVIVLPLLCIWLAATAMHNSATQARAERIALRFIVGTLVLVGIVGTARYFSWQKSSAKEVASYVTAVSQDSVGMIVRPRAFAPLLNYYYKGAAMQYDEVYLNEPLGGIVDTARAFVYISLDVPNPIRDYMNGHFDKTAERRFPGEAHMGIIVGMYKQKPDTTDE